MIGADIAKFPDGTAVGRDETHVDGGVRSKPEVSARGLRRGVPEAHTQFAASEHRGRFANSAWNVEFDPSANALPIDTACRVRGLRRR